MSSLDDETSHDMNSPRARLENALQDSEPSRAVHALAIALRDEGMSQIEMHQLFDEFRAKHANDTDETYYDAVLDSMDFIVGWCSPSFRLYPTELHPPT
ncbi:hypothetical protein [Prosthecobacter debontii]|uniref:hypothetical protein n=1 Tax=Prosthecobacter debontii TaxID=48467 RepID=UPI001C377255|nr:hypothetical protein [Prosthecobacter debontii]